MIKGSFLSTVYMSYLPYVKEDRTYKGILCYVEILIYCDIEVSLENILL